MSTGLADFLEAIHQAEGTGYGSVGQTVNGVTPFGHYGMLQENWPSWSAAAGIRGHDMFDPAAQDRVAGFFGQKLFQRYGSWDMVAGAWFAGQQTADFFMRNGKGVKGFTAPETQEFLNRFTSAYESIQGSDANPQVPVSALKWINNVGGGGQGWINPIAGESEYSNSFQVARPGTKTGIHGAIDVYSARGTPIVAPVGGKILASRVNDGKGGNWVQMLGNDGLTYYFAHMEGMPRVAAGQQVGAGANLGFVGDSGSAKGTKPHLHFSIKRSGVLVNPYSYLEGAHNSGNTFQPQQGNEFVINEAPVKDKFNSLLESVSNQVASGARVDYRTLESAGVEQDIDTKITESGKVAL